MFLIRDRGFRPISLAIARASPESRHRFLASRHCASLVVCPILRVLLDAVWPQRTILALPGPARFGVFSFAANKKSPNLSNRVRARAEDGDGNHAFLQGQAPVGPAGTGAPSPG